MPTGPFAGHGANALGHTDQHANLDLPHPAPTPAPTPAPAPAPAPSPSLRIADVDALGEWAWVTDIHAPGLTHHDPSLDTNLTLPTAASSSALSANVTSSVPLEGTVQISLHYFRDLASTARQFARRYTEFSVAREELLSLRGEATFARRECLRRHRLLQDAQHHLNLDLFNLADSGDNRSKPLKLSQLRLQADNDYKALQMYDERTRTLESRLSATEFHIRDKESALADLAGSFLDRLHQSGLVPEIEAERDVVSSTIPQRSRSLETASPRLPLPLEEYCDKVGTVKWRREAIADLVHEYHDIALDRSFWEDRGEALDPSDDDFQADYIQKLREAQEALDRAVRDVEDARMVCIRQGLNPDDHLPTGHYSQELMTGNDPESERLPWPPDPVIGRNVSSSRQTNVTGPLRLDSPSSRGQKYEANHTDTKVEEWIEGTVRTPEYPLDFDSFELQPKSRPTSFSRRSIYDLKPAPEVKDPEIRDRLPEQFEVPTKSDRTPSAPSVYARGAVDRRARLNRSHSEPGCVEMNPEPPEERLHGHAAHEWLTKVEACLQRD